MAEYKLAASLAGHEDDVRAVAFPSPKAIVSGSRDGTVRLFKLLSDNPPLYDATISSHTTAFVNTVSYVPPSAQFPEGLILSGGKDTIIDVRQPSKKPEDNAEAMLIGHSGNVCALDVDPAGKYIVSGSWDSEARIWLIGTWDSERSAVLKGHTASVWGVLAYDAETIVTASADQKIRVFHTSGKLLRTIKAGNDVVRALCRVTGHPSGADFASAGNDGIIRLWTIGGKQVGELRGHENFIYNLVSSPSGELISCSEDRTARIWKGTECIQTITHPAISVWGAAVCAENGDIVTGASDRIVRVWTRNPERYADAETTRQFDDAVKESSIPQQSLGEINKENLPGPEFLKQKSGTKEGQVQMIRELNGNITAHTWSAGAGEWVSIGTVVDAAASGKKVDHLGKDYDYVFDVDIEEGKPPLKLPYNLSQNPYEAASKFITDNELPITYLDQVANFITTNTQGATIGQSQDTPSAPGSDPWGSDQRYRPGNDSSSSPTPSNPLPAVLPQKEYISITSARVPKAQEAIEKLNKSLIENGQKDISLNPSELTLLSSLCKTIGATGDHGAAVSAAGLDLVLKIITQWPYKDRLPGLDLMRLITPSPLAAAYTHPRYGNIITILKSSVLEADDPAENNIMMSIRAFCNLFSTPAGRTLALAEFSAVQDLLASALLPASPSPTQTTNRNVLVAATTLYINYSVLLLSLPDSERSFDHVLALFDTLVKILGQQKDSEVVYRGLVAVGTLLKVGDEERDAGRDVYEVGGLVEKVVGRVGEPRVRRVVGEIRRALKG